MTARLAHAVSTRVSGTTAVAVCMAFAFGLGCVPTGGERYSDYAQYDAPGRQYRLHYLSPPWRVDASEGTTLELVIPGNAAAFVPEGVDIDPKFHLLVTVHGESAAALFDAERSASVMMGETLEVDPRAVTTDAGIEGQEFLSVIDDEPTRYKRVVVFPRASGGAVRLRFEAYPELDSPEMDAMIGAVEIDFDEPDMGPEE